MKKALLFVCCMILAANIAFAKKEHSRHMHRYNEKHINSSVPGISEYPLTDEQKKSISSLRKDEQAQIAQLRSNRSIARQERQKKMLQIRKKTHDKIMSILTPAQRGEVEEHFVEKKHQKPYTRYGKGPSNTMGKIPGLIKYPLTDEQTQKISKYRMNASKELMKLNQDRYMTPSDKDQKKTDIHKRMKNSIMNTLTDEQKNEFNEWWKNHPHRQ